MSKMSNLVVQIQDLTENGYDAEDIALILEVPKSWVFEALQEYNTPEESYYGA